MNDIDKNIQQSRETFKMFEEKLRVMTELNWQEAYQKAIRRHNDECSICMNNYETLLVCLLIIIQVFEKRKINLIYS
jgi:hypothetical protein